MEKQEELCIDYKQEKDNPYSLCDNPDCKDKEACNISLYMNEEPYWGGN